jgi:hypothetical protein
MCNNIVYSAGFVLYNGHYLIGFISMTRIHVVVSKLLSAVGTEIKLKQIYG